MDFKEKMLIEEYQELVYRLDILQYDLNEKKAKDKLGEYQYNLMTLQYLNMTAYQDILEFRMKNLGIDYKNIDTTVEYNSENDDIKIKYARNGFVVINNNNQYIANTIEELHNLIDRILSCTINNN